MARVGWIVPGLVCLTLGVAPPAQAQSNLDAGKSPAQIFSDTCNACHRSPRELKPTSPSFLREHYTTGGREAAAMAAYVASVGSDPRAVQQRRPPTMGAGQAAPAADPSRPPSDPIHPGRSGQAAASPGQRGRAEAAAALGQRRDDETAGNPCDRSLTGTGRNARPESAAPRPVRGIARSDNWRPRADAPASLDGSAVDPHSVARLCRPFADWSAALLGVGFRLGRFVALTARFDHLRLEEGFGRLLRPARPPLRARP